MNKSISIPYETSGVTEADLFNLMNEYLSDDELLRYMKEERKIEQDLSSIIIDDFEKIRLKLSTVALSADWPSKGDRIEQLIQEIITWPEFVPTLLDMHFRGVIDINALYQETQRNEVA